MEPFYPLHVRVCDACFLVQLSEYVRPDEIFTEYAYFSSFSTSWLDHARRYTDMIAERLALGPDSRVVEIASNDGYLLQYFVQKGIPAFGVEPAANVARAAEERGVPTWVGFFGAGQRRGARPDPRPRRSDDREQRARAGARPERLRRGIPDPARSRPAS